MPSVPKIVAGTPEAAMNVYYHWKRPTRSWQANFAELIPIGSVCNASVGWRRRQLENVFRIHDLILRLHGCYDDRPQAPNQRKDSPWGQVRATALPFIDTKNNRMSARCSQREVHRRTVQGGHGGELRDPHRCNHRTSKTNLPRKWRPSLTR